MLILVGVLSLAACIDEPTFELADQRTEQTVNIDPTTPSGVDPGASGRTPDAAAPPAPPAPPAATTPAPKPAPKPAPAPRPAPAPPGNDDRDDDNGKGKGKDDD